MRLSYRKGFWAFIVIGIIILILSLCLWIIFPLVFPVLVNKNLILSAGDGGYLGKTSFYWSKPPINNIMYFYFFNVTNPDEVVYFGEKPVLHEVGPYAMRESEQKRDVEFSEDGEEVYYKNYKRYVYVKEYSCAECPEDALLTIPNGPALGALSGMIDPQYGCSDTCRLLVDIGLLLLGEYPFRTVKFIEVTFDGYEDPFLRFAHSELFTALGDIFNNGSSIVPINIPEMERMAYFFGYNNSNDEDYTVKTGKGNIDDLGKVVRWAGSDLLPNTWWDTLEARMINGSESGGFNGPNLKKDTVIPFFQSFMCRSFYMIFKNESEVSGIPCYTFEVPPEAYDTTRDENAGFRYRNTEKVNYYKDWSPCPNKTLGERRNCSDLQFVDCSKQENFCHECCDGSFVDGTYLLPPGMFPLVCYPGKNETPPFTIVYSAPHFYFAPDEVLNSVRGLSPPDETHIPFLFDHEPKSGMVTQVRYRLMASMPMFRHSHATISTHLPDVIVPVFWIDSHAVLQDFLYDTVTTAFVTLPKAINISKIVSLVVAFICFVISFWCRFHNAKAVDLVKNKFMNHVGGRNSSTLIITDGDGDSTSPDTSNIRDHLADSGPEVIVYQSSSSDHERHSLTTSAERHSLQSSTSSSKQTNASSNAAF